MIGAFGETVFQVSSNRIYTFDGLKISGQLDTQTQKLAGKKPSTYIEGPALETIALSIPLDFAFGINVQAEITEWRTQRDSAVPKPFNLGGKPLSANKWLLKKVDVSDPKITANGKIQSATLNLTFEEYVRPGTPPKSTGSSSGAATTDFNIDNVKAWEDSQEDKADKKRENPNATKAISAGKKSKIDRLRL